MTSKTRLSEKQIARWPTKMAGFVTIEDNCYDELEMNINRWVSMEECR